MLHELAVAAAHEGCRVQGLQGGRQGIQLPLLLFQMEAQLAVGLFHQACQACFAHGQEGIVALEVQPARRLFDPALPVFDAGHDPFVSPVRQCGQVHFRFADVKESHLGRVGRRRRPHVSGIIGQGRIRFMADGRNDRYAGMVNGLDHSRAVEAPQVFHGAAAAADDEDVQVLAPAHLADGLGDSRIDAVALDGNGMQDDFGIRIALAGNLINVVEHGAGLRRQDADAPGEARQLLLVAAVEIALSRQFVLDAFVLGLQRPGPLGKELFNDKGKGAAFFIDVDGADDDDMVPFADGPDRCRHAAAEDDGPDGTLIIADIHIIMAVRRPLETDDVAFHSDALQAVIAVDIIFDAADDVRNRCIFHDFFPSCTAAQKAAPDALSALKPSAARFRSI